MQEVNTSVTERTETLQQQALITAPPRPKTYGWISRLRSYLIFDPLIWLYTVVLGIISVPCSIFGDTERILHTFARFWSRLIMKTVVSPVKVTGLERIDTSKPYVYAVNHGSALDIPLLDGISSVLGRYASTSNTRADRWRAFGRH